ncbi:MAG: DUF2851 family protein [Salinivirgaceae bacterium]|jgi:hypothetical protein|nr:DUF2851 family protein [Salinivirgaceae bacterium]
MKEDFLHYLWKYQLFNKQLKDANGNMIEVINPGMHNNNSGPDFFNAKVKIGETVWAGNVEIHVKASDWFRHKHELDKAYDSIILHVVAENDIEVTRNNGEKIPTVKIISHNGVFEQYQYLMESKNWVPCENFIQKVNEFTIFEWKQSLMVERLELKSRIIEKRWLANNKDWEETFYQTLAANFGFKTNALPFEMLAKSLPIKYLGKHKDQLPLIEAMLLGQSGLLPETSTNEYAAKLISDYSHLSNKFNLKPLKAHIWKFSKLRPSNFPTLRIAQFAALIYNSASLLSKILETSNFDEVHKFFQIEASEYWQSHYVFGKEVAKRNKKFGDTAFNNVLINTVAPFFTVYARLKGKPEFSEKAIDWLSVIKPEQNHITKHWQQMGLEIKNAFDSQSLIQLKNIYCNQRRCLNCRIGNQVIQHKF